MRVRVRLFAAARELAQADAVELELPEAATLGELRRRLAESKPALANLLRHSRFAVGSEFAADGDRLPPDADVACIPPVSGG